MLNLFISYSGGCKDHYVGAYAVQYNLAPDVEPHVTLDFFHYDDNDPCDAWIAGHFIVSLRPIAEEYLRRNDSLRPITLQVGDHSLVYNPGERCRDVRGNVDCDGDDLCDVGDLTVLIDLLFTNGQPVYCSDEANVDGSADGIIDVGDVTVLIDHLFLGGPDPAPCP